MRNRTFEFEIVGQDVSPDTVSVRDLFDVVSNLESALAATAKQGGAKDQDDLFVSIIGISPGSDRVRLAVSEKMFKAAGRVATAIATNDFSKIPMPAHGRIRDLWKKAKSTNWTMRFRPDGNGITDASIIPETEILKPGAIEGATTIYGLVERVGGAQRQTVQFLLCTGERRTFDIKTKELAKEIGTHLHEVIGIDGDAIWDIDSWDLSDFKATGVAQYKDASPTEAFEALATVAGGRWDDVNADEYVSELRSD